MLNLLTCLSETKRLTKGGRERRRATPFIMSPLSSSPDSVLLKIWSPERASRIYFSLKDGLGPACLRVSKQQPKALNRHTQRRKERTLLSDAQIIIALHPPPSCNPALKLKFLRLKELIQDNEDLCAKKQNKKRTSKNIFVKFCFAGVV